jgi:MFS family permease
MAILSSFPQDQREKYIGMVEASFGIGMLFGPIIGAFLYSFGGYMVPFITFASLYLAVLPFIVFSLIRAKKMEPNDQTSVSAQSGKNADIELSVLVKKPRFSFGLLSQMCITMTL